MLIGYVCVFKVDGLQFFDLQYDVLCVVGVEWDNIYDDFVFGGCDDCFGLIVCFKLLCDGDVLVVWKFDCFG